MNLLNSPPKYFRTLPHTSLPEISTTTVLTVWTVYFYFPGRNSMFICSFHMFRPALSAITTINNLTPTALRIADLLFQWCCGYSHYKKNLAQFLKSSCKLLVSGPVPINVPVTLTRQPTSAKPTANLHRYWSTSLSIPSAFSSWQNFQCFRNNTQSCVNAPEYRSFAVGPVPYVS